jgi:hypothetical protein
VPAHAARRSLMQIVVLCAALALALLAPGSAGAHESAATKLAIKAQRQQRRDARKAANEAQRSARQSEREARRAVRQAERGDGSSEAPSTSEAPTGEVGAGETHDAPPTGVKTQPATTPGVKTQTATTPASGCSVTAASSAAQVTSGEAVTLSGKLTCPAGVSVEGQEVTVSQREAASAAGGSASSLASAGTAATAAAGSYEFHTADLSGRSTFVLRVASARRPARVVVRVDAGVTLAGSAASGAAVPMGAGRSAGGPTRMSFSGTVQPAAPGIGVGLRVRYVGDEWRTVATAHTDAEGHYSFSHRFRYAGDVEVVTTAHPHGEQRTESTPLSYTIVQAQNPALTIESSAAPTAIAPTAPTSPALDATPTPTPATSTPAAPTPTPTPAATTPTPAAPTTISGVASNAANQTVTLLARTSAGRFAPVATVLADETGAYSFTVEPTQTTIYEVSCGKDRSTQVRVEVS